MPNRQLQSESHFISRSHILFCPRLKLQQTKASQKANVADKAWKAASPMKQSVCPGDFIGTFGGKVDYMPVSRYRPAE